MFIEIDTIVVDIDALAAIAHECNPVGCISSPGCCQRYEVWINKRELNRITGFIPLAASFSRHLKKGNSFKNVFEEEESGLFSIDKAQRNQCVFSYDGKQREMLCSLHSAAEKTGIPPETVKPTVCTLWPLALTETKKRCLSIDDEAYSFPCNSRRSTREPLLHPGIADIIKKIFGTPFLKKIDAALNSDTPAGKQSLRGR